MRGRRAQIARESLKNRGLRIFVKIEDFSGPCDLPTASHHASQDDVMPSMLPHGPNHVVYPSTPSTVWRPAQKAVVDVRFATAASSCPPTWPTSRSTSWPTARRACRSALLEEAESLLYCPTLPSMYVSRSGVLRWEVLG
jgi:hypothetical protein